MSLKRWSKAIINPKNWLDWSLIISGVVMFLFIYLITGGIRYTHTFGRTTEAEAVDRYATKWEECMANPDIRVDVAKKVFLFSCPRKNSELPPNVHPESKKWRCRTVVDCQHVDWRYFDPEDACTYEMMTFTMPENPEEHPDTRRAVSTSYGGWCEEIK